MAGGKTTVVSEQEAYLTILCRAVQEIAKAQNYVSALKDVARTVVPYISDWCAIDVADEHGNLQRLATAHVDPKKASKAFRLAKEYPRAVDAGSGTSYVYRTGEPNMQNGITDDMLVAAAVNEEHLSMMRELSFCSMMIVPMKSRNKILGTLTFVWSEVGKTYSLADLAFAEVLGSLAGSAVDTAQLVA